ncbi:MAG: ATP-dependent DNA helicase RecG [Deltaproteobacteria bacterium]|nr:ATP-dependent DNA helicase RecG [Deltaproteobacteria bacterium]
MRTPPPQYLKQVPELRRPLTSLKGVGPGRAALFAGRGPHTLLDLLFYLPLRYEDRRVISPINEAAPDRDVLVMGRVVSFGERLFAHTRKRMFRAIVQDDGGRLELLWFHYRPAHLKSIFKKDMQVLAYGRVRPNRGVFQMIHPDIRPLTTKGAEDGLGIYPVYSPIEKLSGRFIANAVQNAAACCEQTIPDAVPRAVTLSLGLPVLGSALLGAHFPPRDTPFQDLSEFSAPFHRRLVFDRFTGVMLNVLARKRRREERSCPAFSIPGDFSEQWARRLPFMPTGDQQKAVEELVADMRRGRPMNRLLQGDVGCGKTAVAAAAAWAAVSNGTQAALMVPTQVLARQHQASFDAMSADMGFNTALLTGALRGAERRRVLRGIETGAFNLVIGTQALIRDAVVFHRLGLAIIDEQHRFGVRQRALLDGKGDAPHLLVMTATPIPRTLAMTVYADLSVTTIREYPKDRLPVVTRLVSEDMKRDVYEAMAAALSRGRQAMVVCPVIETSEDNELKDAVQMAEGLRKLFEPRFKVGLVHGRLPADEKDLIMERFRRREIQILVGTTVIEVGIHAPDATLMVVEHPERFGLAQLHQLRGRVGRGSAGGLCFMMMTKGLSDQARSRLSFLEKSNDGFAIAGKDLELRGQGELTGLRQAGAGELDFRDMLREPELLMAAKTACENILAEDPDLMRPEHAMLKTMIESDKTGPSKDPAPQDPALRPPPIH